MTETQTHTLVLPGVDLVYDVRGPLPPVGGQPVLFMIGQPMTADGFEALASHFRDRTVVTYDPRGLGRSVRSDGRSEHTPQQQAADLHLLIEALGVGPVDMFASSGGAVTALELVAAHPGDVGTLVAHEPPINAVLPDAEAAERARFAFHDAYQAKGTGAGMAAFIAMTSWEGEFTDAYFAQPQPDPGMFGLPTDDDGSRDDPLLSKNSWAISDYRPYAEALAAAPTRIVVAVGEESAETYTARTAVGTAALLGQQATVFPSHHGGFLGGQFGYAGKPEEFAARLREVLAAGGPARANPPRRGTTR
nr:alpha/beta hydrolase [Micromonospora sp. DSM 115978]